MANYNPVNERIKRKYLRFQKEARRQSEATIDSIAKSLVRFEEYTKWKDFKKFHSEQAIGFKKYLASQVNKRTGKPLSKSTLNSTLNNLKKFFEWLSQEPGYKSRIDYRDAEYLNLSGKDVRIAGASRPKAIPTLEQIKHVIGLMPFETAIQKRDRALLAFIFLTGARDGAVVSMSLKHVDIIERCVWQDAREVKTKFSKTFVTYFFPVGVEIEQIVIDWLEYLREELFWGNDDPLFPCTNVEVGKNSRFGAAGLKRVHWKTASSIRKIFREAFTYAGLQYFHPHTIRHTLGRLGEQRCKTPEEFKAWSQNLGHENVMTTFASYGEVPNSRQRELICNTADYGKLKDESNHELLEKIKELVG